LHRDCAVARPLDQATEHLVNGAQERTHGSGGGRLASFDTLDGMVRQVADWGVDAVPRRRAGLRPLGVRRGCRRVVELKVCGRAGAGFHHRPEGGVRARSGTGSEVGRGGPSTMVGVLEKWDNLARA
jgi:hypothetical protein